MAKTDNKKSKSSSSAKRGKAKTTGNDPIDVDTPPPPKKQKDAAKRAEMYFSTTCKKGYTVNPWSKGTKNYIDVVFHNGGVPDSSEEPNITLDEGGKALRVEWKLPEKLFTAMQATAQSIPVDSARYNGYCNTQDQMKAAGVHPVKKCYRPVPQVVSLEHECTGVPKTFRFGVPTINHVPYENGWQHQFNSMYVLTIKVAKNHHILTTGLESIGIANFGDVEPARGGYGSGGGYSGNVGWSNAPPGRVVSSLAASSSNDAEKK